MLDINYSTLNVFPWEGELSEGIEHEGFSESFFIQPDLFLRLRPGKESVVKQKLEERKKSDSAFAKNAYAQLDFVYRNSSYYEPSHNRYPVYRVK